MNEMIERVAKAIRDAVASKDIDDHELYMMGDHTDPTGIETSETLARAAITAMREPTENMQSIFITDDFYEDGQWQVMIDKALE